MPLHTFCGYEIGPGWLDCVPDDELGDVVRQLYHPRRLEVAVEQHNRDCHLVGFVSPLIALYEARRYAEMPDEETKRILEGVRARADGRRRKHLRQVRRRRCGRC